MNLLKQKIICFVFCFCRAHGTQLYFGVESKFLRCGGELSTHTEAGLVEAHCTKASSGEPQWNKVSTAMKWTPGYPIISISSTSAGASKFWLQVVGKRKHVFPSSSNFPFFLSLFLPPLCLSLSRKNLCICPSIAPNQCLSLFELLFNFHLYFLLSFCCLALFKLNTILWKLAFELIFVCVLVSSAGTPSSWPGKCHTCTHVSLLHQWYRHSCTGDHLLPHPGK